MPKIQKLHASFIWTQSDTSLPGAMATMKYLGNRREFVDHFATMPQYLQRDPEDVWLTSDDRKALADIFDSPVSGTDTLNTLHWALPWELREDRKYTNYFWRYYLGQRELKNVTGDDAWNHLVPLRLRLPLRLASPWSEADRPTVRIFADGYAYPHGSALEIKLHLDYNRSLSEEGFVLGDLLELHRDGVSVSLPGGMPQHFSLQGLAESLLECLRHLVWGETIPQNVSLPSSKPLRVVTIIKGSIDSTSASVDSGSPLHKVLDGFCSFVDHFGDVRAEDLTPLDKANLLIGSQTEGHIGSKTTGHYIYHNPLNPHSRLVWMPNYFTSNTSNRHPSHKLSCYHRNLVLLSLQTEMLAQALFLFEKPPKKPAIPVPKDLAKAAAQRLTELYGSKKDKTYVSASPRAYLDGMNYTDDMKYTEKINEILHRLNLPHLQWTAWGEAGARITTPSPSP